MEYIYENEDLLKVETNTSVIPSNTLSFTEDAMYVAEAADVAFYQLFESVGIEELAVYESTGSQIVYEGEQAEGFKQKVIAMWQKLWGVIKGAFENMIAKFNTLTKDAKEKIVKKIDVDKLPEKSYGKVHTFPGHNALDYKDNAYSFATYVTSEFEKIASAKDAEKNKALRSELEAKVCSKVYDRSDSGVESVKALVEKITKDWMGEEVEVDKKYLQNNFKSMSDLVIGGSAVKTIKDLYKTTRKFIDEMISNAKKYNDDRITVAKNEIAVLSAIGKAMHHANSAVLSAKAKQYAEYRNILVKCSMIKADKEEEKAEEKKEESTTESVIAHQIDLIESAFAW